MVRLFFCFIYKQIQIFQIYFNFFFLTIPTFKIEPKQMLLLPPHIRLPSQMPFAAGKAGYNESLPAFAEFSSKENSKKERLRLMLKGCRVNDNLLTK